MKKIGTFTSAIGFIYLGVWMIINKSDPQLGELIFKFWPVLIVGVGLEILFQLAVKNHEKIGFNPLIILVLIAFVTVNAFQGISKTVKYNLKNIEGNFSLNDFVDWVNDVDIKNYAVINASSTFQRTKDVLNLNADNGKVILEESQDNNIRVEAKIYADKKKEGINYRINKMDIEGETKLNFKESYIKKVEITLYLPKDIKIKLNVNNLNLIQGENSLDTQIFIDSNNCNVDIKDKSKVSIDCNNGRILAENVNDIKINGNNATVTVKGKAENINIDVDNGKIDIDNKKCKNIKIDMDNGVVNLKTEDKDVNVNIDLEQGVTKINEERRVNSGIRKVLGNGNGIVNINVDRGTVEFKSQEW
ncbi:hypothetical protein Q428_11440 [Fervidicella metallireducens AeB]|uniref:DUF4097 domain-containing protein n=1 Tax=Fervidicella metallireducens AeB TaxID=1403537 RepID=A0A017RT13_9CLOT|nr:DUF4097 family beta strand repeat-containing protein [Fervidicella metallireducens]EYE87812.1 hypothetical protein Q428_11440 [Fervidicella metallireducens AeB]